MTMPTTTAPTAPAATTLPVREFVVVSGIFFPGEDEKARRFSEAYSDRDNRFVVPEGRHLILHGNPVYRDLERAVETHFPGASFCGAFLIDDVEQWLLRLKENVEDTPELRSYIRQVQEVVGLE